MPIISQVMLNSWPARYVSERGHNPEKMLAAIISGTSDVLFSREGPKKADLRS
jgi:hypothetical protein